MRAHLILDALWVIESNPLVSFDQVGHLLVIDPLDSGTLGDELTDLGIPKASSARHHEERKKLLGIEDSFRNSHCCFRLYIKQNNKFDRKSERQVFH